MTTICEVIKYTKETGEVKTETTWAVYDCKNKQWTNKPPVVLRNILLAALNPLKIFTIGEIDKYSKEASLLLPFTVLFETSGDKQVFSLDLASNARSHGRFTFAIEQIGKQYYDVDWKRIIYGSILHTGCKKVAYKEINYLVVDDENTVTKQKDIQLLKSLILKKYEKQRTILKAQLVIKLSDPEITKEIKKILTDHYKIDLKQINKEEKLELKTLKVPTYQAPLDDPIHNIHWRTGDSHAKASQELIDLMKLDPADQVIEYDPNNPPDIVIPDPETNPKVKIPIQFRIALSAEDNPKKSGVGWIGKGTLAHNPLLDSVQPEVGKKVDLVIPLSSLKGRKPPLGLYTGKLYLGTVFEGQQRQAKGGWMLFQWIKYETLEADGIIDKMKTEMTKLSAAFNSMRDLADLFAKEIEQSKFEEEVNSDDEILVSTEYEDIFIKIIQNDPHGLLLLHPYLVNRVMDRLRKRWLNMAKSAGVRFYSLMCQPDESLAYHNIWEGDQIVGGKIFCAASMSEGEYIVFCNPMRHWGDVQIWTNVHEGEFTETSGTLAAPKLLLLSLGRDSDGDFVQLIKVSKYPNITEEIKKFSPSPKVKKLPKVPLKGSFQQIAINSMTDMTGIVASLLARARSANVELEYMLIPDLNGKKENMRIIDFLSQELQIAVDSLKSSYPNNKQGLNAVGAYLDKLNTGYEEYQEPDPDFPTSSIDKIWVQKSTVVPWLKGFKNEETYRSEICPVDNEASDTISRLVQLTNSYWKKPDLKTSNNAYTFKNVLFTSYLLENDPDKSDKPVDNSKFEGWLESKKVYLYQYDYAKAMNMNYGKDINQAMIQKKLYDNENAVTEVVQYYKSQKSTILAQFNSQTGQLFPVKTWAAAFWKACNTDSKTSTAGLAFNLFSDEIIEELQKKQSVVIPEISVFSVNHNYYGKHPNWGQPCYGKSIFNLEVKIRAVIAEFKGFGETFKGPCIEMSVDNGPFILAGGITSSYANYVPLGEVRTMRAFIVKPFSVVNKKIVLGNPPYYNMVLWDKAMIPELNQGLDVALEFITEKQNKATGQDWKYHPKTWLAQQELNNNDPN